jgi:hypothetical protein
MPELLTWQCSLSARAEQIPPSSPGSLYHGVVVVGNSLGIQ